MAITYTTVDITNSLKSTQKHSSSNWKDWVWPIPVSTEWYVYVGNKCRPMLRFTTPSVGKIVSSGSASVRLEIPWHRYSNDATGTMYLKLSTDEETAKGVLPSSSNYDASFSCASPTGRNTTGLATVTFNNILPNKTYYITFYGTSSVDYINIGPNTKADDDLYNPNHYAFKAEYTYAAYTSVGAPKIDIIDNYNNTFTINVTKGANGTNNIAKGLANLTWKVTGASTSTSFTSGTTVKLPANLTKDDTISITVSASTVGELDTVSTSKARKIYQYLAPLAPNAPAISYSKNKFTVKEPWTVMYEIVTATNSTSKICGYLCEMYVNNELVDSITTTEQPVGAVSLFNYFYPERYNITTGDEITWRVSAFTRYGLNNDGNILYGQGSWSLPYTVESAGIVHVKVNGEYKEGQVYVKIGGEWREAETVHVKAGGEWHESE